ncbi:MAG: hypothetical protein ABL871_15350 [Terricaulis sp.]
MFRALAALVCLLLCGTANAQPARGVATVEARLVEDGLRADVRLSHAVTTFAFQQADVVREEDFTLLTDGLTLSGDSVSSSTPFRRFSVLVRPMARERDGKYPAFFRVGGGGVIYAPALTGESEGWRTTLRLRTAPGQVLAPAGGPGPEGFAFIGPRDQVTTIDGIVLVSGPEAPPELRDAALGILRSAMHFYTERVGVPLQTRPTMVITHRNDAGNYGGDVTPAPLVNLRFYGDKWLAPDAAARAELGQFVSHEAFHFWNGSLVTSREGTPSWLHEGSATYAALLAERANGNLNDTDMLAALSAGLSDCQNRLRFFGDVPLNSFQFLSSGLRYPCGMLIQWTSDLAVHAHSGGERDVLDVWGHVTRAALARPDRTYGLSDFTGDADMATGAPIIALIAEQSGAERWTDLRAALRSFGATIEERRTNATRRDALLAHLAGLSCATGSRGFGITGDQVSVNAECGVLESGPTITSVEGSNPIDVSEAHYAHIQQVCAAGGNLALVLNGSQRVGLPCQTPLPQAEYEYVVAASPTLN